MTSQRIVRVPSTDALPRDQVRTGVLQHPVDLADALTQLGEVLDFPGWYGRNLDAAWDCLTDLVEPTRLVWRGWSQLAVEHPRDWADLLSLFRDRASEGPAFELWLVDA